MRNAGLKNSNYCKTVVGVAPPLYVTRKILYICCTVYNGAEELQHRPQLTSLNNAVDGLPERILHTHQNETRPLNNLLCQLQWLPFCESLDVV